MTKAVGRSCNVRATAFPESTDVDISFWILSIAVSVEVKSLNCLTTNPLLNILWKWNWVILYRGQIGHKFPFTAQVCSEFNIKSDIYKL